MARFNPRRRIDQLAREAAQALASRRDITLLSDAELNAAAIVTQSDTSSATALWREANAGSPLAGLLDGPAGESERG